jgi:hypothetical protein
MTYFSFSLEEFAREILSLIDVLDELKRYLLKPCQREWRWLLFWSRKGPLSQADMANAERTRHPTKYSIPVQGKESPREPSTKRGALKYRIWKALEELRNPEIKFAIKVGVGAILLALPAFTREYRELYTRWRGEWALLSYFVIIANSVGATTSIGLWRLISLRDN